MLSQRVFFVLIISCTVLIGQAEFNATEMCSYVANSTKLKDPNTCNTWYECIDLQAIKHECPDGYFYDLEPETCALADTVTCVSTNPCETLVNGTGFVVDPYSCNKYYYCSDYEPTQGSCKTNWTYDPTSQTCVKNMPCVLPIDPDSYCNIIPNGIFIKDRNNCQNYQVCWKQELINSTCGSEFYFDSFQGACTQNLSAACPSINVNANATASVASCKQNGQFISDDGTCDGYYYCFLQTSGTYQLVFGTCKAGYFFDASGDSGNGACVPRSQIVCNYDRCAGLGLQHIQLANLSGDNCQGYAVCQDNVEIGSGVCPLNEYFNEEIQLCTKEVVSFVACATNSTTPT